MKKIYLLLFMITGTCSNLFSETISLEAENGLLTGVQVANSIQGYTGAGYVTGMDADGDQFTLTFDVTAGGMFDLSIGYHAQSLKKQDVYINDAYIGNIEFPATGGFDTLEVGSVFLTVGINTIRVVKSWGWMEFDNVNFSSGDVVPHSYQITDGLRDTYADDATVALFDYLKMQYGEQVISGQFDYWDELKALAGKTPKLRAFDFQNYSPMNPWGWGSGPEWGAWDDGTTQAAIDWHQSTGGCGIVSFQWHWFSPSGGQLRTSTFYTDQTSFDVSKGVTIGTSEYQDVIRDIDAIAVQLKRLQQAGVPVLWRPLHEAGGGWFWWGAGSAEDCLALWDILYDRLTSYHGLHNLIWVWSTPEEPWYPGNEKVDVFGYDSYPGPNNYTAQKIMFDNMYEICSGERILAMTENGPIPDIDAMFNQDARWAYFSSWNDLVAAQNETAHIQQVFSHEKVIDLADPCGVLTHVDETPSAPFRMFPNPASDYLSVISEAHAFTYSVLDVCGKTVLQGCALHDAKLELGALPSGTYILRLKSHAESTNQQFVISAR